MWVSMRSDDTEDLASSQGNITRLRLIQQGERTFANTDGGATFTPSAEIGLRHDAEGYEEWGLSGAIRMSPGAGGRGLTVSVAPEWGHTGSASQHLWSAPDARALESGTEFEPTGRLVAEAGYGFGLGGNTGVVTPYAGVVFGEESARTLRGGAKWQLADDVAVSPEATRNETGGAGAYAVAQQTAVRF